LGKLEKIIDEELYSFGKRFDAPAEAVFPEVRRFVLQKLPLLLQQEAALLDGWQTVDLECRRTWVDQASSSMLEGRVDRIAVLPPGGETAVIDYKKQNRVVPSSFGSQSERPGSYQLPMYVWLFEQTAEGNNSVTKALYYDVTKEKYVKVLPFQFRGVVVDRERFDQVVDQMLETVRDVVRNIRELDVRMKRNDSKVCGRCSFRDVCRGRFSVR
ncbi:MAG: PD-(D/E)XK nuclease family protein, partial [Spirochaetales bacterium]|nr:PD-(D/E)XK nuclease family protein [Spirochaetales bacterium]